MKTVALSIIAMVLSACSSNMPAPSVSEYVKTELGGFTVVRDEGVRYAMTYTLLQPSESATFYKVAFDSTTSKGEHLTTEGTLVKVESAGGTINKPMFSFPGGRRFHFIEPSGNELAVWSNVGI